MEAHSGNRRAQQGAYNSQWLYKVISAYSIVLRGYKKTEFAHVHDVNVAPYEFFIKAEVLAHKSGPAFDFP